MGDNVRTQPLNHNEKQWNEATVSRKLTGRSYEVQMENGRTYRRNRRFLRQTRHSTHSFPKKTRPDQMCLGNTETSSGARTQADTQTRPAPTTSLPALNTDVLSQQAVPSQVTVARRGPSKTIHQSKLNQAGLSADQLTLGLINLPCFFSCSLHLLKTLKYF